MFKVKGSFFETMVLSFIYFISDVVYKASVIKFFCDYSPVRKLQRGKNHFREKHKIYGFKENLSVLSNGIEIVCKKNFCRICF